MGQFAERKIEDQGEFCRGLSVLKGEDKSGFLMGMGTHFDVSAMGTHDLAGDTETD